MAQVFISVGSNIEREKHLQAGLDALADLFGELQLSPVYESVPVGFDGENFFNMVVGFNTQLEPEKLVETLHEIEAKFDRRRDSNRFSSRTLDLDVLLYDDLIYEQNGLCLPRKEITEYAFVLQPLADIVGDSKHPLLNKSYSQLWQEFNIKDQSLWQVDFNNAGV